MGGGRYSSAAAHLLICRRQGFVVKKTLIVIAVLLVAAAAAVGGYVFVASKGAPADEIEAKYMGPNDRFVAVAGARVRVREEGPEDAPAILLLHGFTYSLETWDGWAEALKQDYRVIRYDLLGHGLTGPDPKERYSPEERGAFIGDVMDALGLQSAIVAGNSLGGLAAWRFASTNPERVDALILVSPGAYPYNGVSDTPVEIPAAMRAYLLTAPEAGVRASAELVYGDDAKITDKRVETLHDMLRREGNGPAMIRSLEKFTLPDPSEALSRITAPSLIEWGENDILISPEQGKRLIEDIPNARLITYPGVGHVAQEEAPAETVADAIAFLASPGAPSAGE